MREKLAGVINTALDMLYANDKHLIYNAPDNYELDHLHHVGERSIVFRFAHYLQNLMDADEELHNYVLDCEYNRNGVNAKILPSFPEGVFPDIIIHQRGSNKNNLLVCEVKTYWNCDTTRDRLKISEFISPEGEYRFKFGLSLIIERDRKSVHLDWIEE